VWNRVGTFIYRHGGNFYNFQGLRQFKDKFYPVWETRYLVAPNGFAVPKILVDANILISRGSSRRRAYALRPLTPPYVRSRIRRFMSFIQNRDADRVKTRVPCD
jgi:hypothetical protein